MEATNSHQDQNVLKNKAEILHCSLVTDQKSRVWTTQTGSSVGLGRLDLTSAQNISHTNSNTELVLEIKEKQDLMVV